MRIFFPLLEEARFLHFKVNEEGIMTENGGLHIPGVTQPLPPVRPLRPVDKKRPRGEDKKKRQRKEEVEKSDDNGGDDGEKGVDIMA